MNLWQPKPSTPDRITGGVYAVELFYEYAPSINKAQLLTKLRVYCGKVSPLDRTENSDLLAFTFEDHMVQYDRGQVPAQCLIASTEVRPDIEKYEEALQQTWGWPEARSVVAQCNATLLITDFMASGLEYHLRFQLFQNIVAAVLEIAPCQAISWQPSQQFIEPTAYLAAQQIGEEYNPLYGALNVRLFRIQNGAAGETLMDTMGLAAFGLPDLQCHFLNLDPDQVGRVLYNSALYIYDAGDVIEDGHTIQGIKPDDKWRCQHEDALVAPQRVVLDLNPGPPYAAGNRKS